MTTPCSAAICKDSTVHPNSKQLKSSHKNALFDNHPDLMDLDLLSAGNYYEGTFDGADSLGSQAESSQWLGALTPNGPQTRKPTKQKNPPSNKIVRQSSTKESLKKKRSLDEAHGTRQRGRPRLDTRDETAAERRRTQIRLAQRAYRQRKETTISALNMRVAALKLTIEKMNKTFLDFNDKAIASNIGKWEPTLAEELRSTVGCFLDYAKSTELDSEMEDEELDPAIPPHTVEHDDARANALSSPSTAGHAAQSQSFSHRTEAAQMVNPSVLPLGYQTYQISENIVHTQSPTFDSDQTLQLRNLDNTTWASVDPVQLYPTDAPHQSPLPSLNEQLAPPLSYSYQETSFARRLLRSTVETAVRLLTDPNSRREDISRFCRFTFTWVTRARCLAKLKSILARTTHENLEFWAAPQWHLGDSGLHYPRSGFDVGSSPPPGWEAKEPMGPRPAMTVETPVDPSLRIESIVKMFGLEGEWFDSNDVEEYLRSKGLLLLDGQSNWVEVDLAPEATLSTTGSPTASSRPSSGGPQSPQNPSPPTYSSIPIYQADAGYWGNESTAMMDFACMGTEVANTESSSFDPKYINTPGLFQTKLYAKSPSKVYLDVEKFIRTLVDSAVCLGRTPGFRKSAIDSAYDMAIREAVF